MARALAGHYNLILVHTNDYLCPHSQQADPALQPVIYKLSYRFNIPDRP